MQKKFLKELEEKLKEEKKGLEEQLNSFAKRDPKVKGDWDTVMPVFNAEHSEEEKQDEVEEYVSRLPIEQSMEVRLQDVDLALEKIKKGKYGKCENCDKNIDIERLKIYPAARMCGKCK